MNRRIVLILAPVTGLLLTSCAIEVPSNSSAPGSATQLPGSAPSYGQPLTSINGQFSVVIMEGARRVSVCKTASPNVEETRWHAEQEQIVVKSRGNHGPATVQLFNSRNGRELGRVMAYDIRGGQPAWAAGMDE